MTLKDIFDMTKRRIDETDTDEIDTNLDNMIIDAINHSYIYELSKHDKRVTSAYIPVVNNIATLPDDIDYIEQISPALIFGERRIGNTILSARDITFTLIYSYIREPLSEMTDELEMSDKYKFLLSTYACYIYFQYRKKNQVADMYLNEYLTQIRNLYEDDNLGEESINDTYETVVSE